MWWKQEERLGFDKVWKQFLQNEREGRKTKYTPIPCWSPVAFAGLAGQASEILHIKEKHEFDATKKMSMSKLSNSQI